jgi:hypothetical protein
MKNCKRWPLALSYSIDSMTSEQGGASFIGSLKSTIPKRKGMEMDFVLRNTIQHAVPLPRDVATWLVDQLKPEEAAAIKALTNAKKVRKLTAAALARLAKDMAKD